MCNITGSFHTDVPLTAKYLRTCIKHFEELQLTQDTSILDANVAGESLDLNHRFAIPLDEEVMAQWSKYISLKRINNLINQDTDEVFTREEIEEYTFNLAPAGIVNTPAAHEWSKKLMDTWDTLKAAVPDNVLQAATTPCDPTEIGVCSHHPRQWTTLLCKNREGPKLRRHPLPPPMARHL